mgnify:CR=1 FL=1
MDSGAKWLRSWLDSGAKWLSGAKWQWGDMVSHFAPGAKWPISVKKVGRIGAKRRGAKWQWGESALGRNGIGAKWPDTAGLTPLSLSSKNGLLVHINEAYMGNHFESLSLTGQGSFWNTVSEFFAQQIRKILSQSVFTSQTEHIGRIWTMPPY